MELCNHCTFLFCFFKTLGKFLLTDVELRFKRPHRCHHTRPKIHLATVPIHGQQHHCPARRHRQSRRRGLRGRRQARHALCVWRLLGREPRRHVDVQVPRSRRARSGRCCQRYLVRHELILLWSRKERTKNKLCTADIFDFLYIFRSERKKKKNMGCISK